MKFILSLLIAFSLNSVSQDKGLDEIMQPDVQPAVELVSLSIEEAIIGCKDIMQTEEGGNGSEGVLVKFYNDDFVMCLVQLYKQVNPAATDAMLGGMLQNTYMDIFSMQSKVSVIARKYSRDIELKVATQYKLLPGSKTIIVENKEAFFGHGATADEPISNIVGFILEI